MSESGKPQLRQITREDIEFLADLQDEMNTQPHQCQADPHTYGMTAWRSPQVEQLYKILHEVDFKQLLEVASDED